MSWVILDQKIHYLQWIFIGVLLFGLFVISAGDSLVKTWKNKHQRVKCLDCQIECKLLKKLNIYFFSLVIPQSNFKTMLTMSSIFFGSPWVWVGVGLAQRPGLGLDPGLGNQTRSDPGP